MLDSQALFAEPDWKVWKHELAAALAAHAGDPERQIDALRHFQHAQTFRLLVQDLNGVLSIERLADHLSALADIVLDATLAACWTQMRGGDAPPPKFAIIGYGKLGGQASSATRRISISCSSTTTTTMRRPRATPGSRSGSTRWLTSATAAGRLYETDLRLRPDGVSGLLVSSLAAFRHYQRNQAWPWEHQALTRARFVAGEHGSARHSRPSARPSCACRATR